jgi:hypothetical protein
VIAGWAAASKGHASAKYPIDVINSRRLIGFPRLENLRTNFSTKLNNECGADVRFGSKADIEACRADVRFTPESGHQLSALGCPLSAKLRLMHRNENAPIQSPRQRLQATSAAH